MNAALFPLVSIIVPTYNQADYLPQCLDSLWFQEWPNLELLVVNDGSTDATAAVLAEYARAVAQDSGSYAAAYDERLDRVERVVHKRYPPDGRALTVLTHETNQGLSRALNTGLRAAAGDLCTFVASDDIALPHMLGTLADAMISASADFAYGDMLIVDDGLRVLRRFSLPGYSFESNFCDWYLCGVAKLYKRDLHERAGIYNPRCHVQDHEMFLRFAELGARFIHVPKALMYVRAHLDDRRVVNHSPANEVRQHRESAELVLRARKSADRPRSVAIIPARGGSKGIPAKNVADLGGKPLIAWSIDSAWNIPGIDRVIVSTDCPHIREAAQDYGAEAPFLRPAELATDTASMHEANMHALAWLRDRGYVPDWWFVLEPTHPFRSAALLRIAVEKLREGYKDMITVRLLDDDLLYGRRFALPLPGSGFTLLPVPPRAAWYCTDGLLYAGNRSTAQSAVPPRGRWLEIVRDAAALVDIDEPEDLDFARVLIDKGLDKPETASVQIRPEVMPAVPHPCRYRRAYGLTASGMEQPARPGEDEVRLEKNWDDPILPFGRDAQGRLLNRLSGALIRGRQDYPPIFSLSREAAQGFRGVEP